MFLLSSSMPLPPALPPHPRESLAHIMAHLTKNGHGRAFGGDNKFPVPSQQITKWI